MSNSYEPALRNCVPVASTLHAGVPIRKPERNSVSVIVPVYAAGWSAAHPSDCKVPTVTHARYRPGFVPGTEYTQMLPAFPETMNDIGVDENFRTTVRVHVNASGAATDAAVARSSGRPAFDDATLAAARTATYPLTTSSCAPLPSDYVWTTTFRTQSFIP
jgi:TonB family protein